MKKILFAAFAVSFLAVGCQKTEIIHQVGPTDGSLMSFSTEMSKLTKSTPADPEKPDTPDADAAGMYNLRAQEFRIWAYCDYEDTNTNDPELGEIYDGMSNLSIAYDKPAADATGTWKPGKEYYWPSAGKHLRFFAVSGAGTSTVAPSMTIDKEAKTTSAPKLTITDYTVNHASPNTDLMVADFIRQDKTTPPTKTVTFNFRHALSKVQFMFKTEGSGDTPVYVQNIKVEGVNTTASLTVIENSAAESTKPIDFQWDEKPSNPKVFEDNYPGDSGFSESGIDKITNDEDNTALLLTDEPKTFATWLVIPQNIVTKTIDATTQKETITKGYNVVVTYVIGKRQFKATFPLYKDNLERWNDNQYTKYLVTITPNKITFSATAEPWTPYNSSDTNTDGDDINLQN